MLEFSDVTAAAARIKGHAHRTPILTSRMLNEQLGCEVFMKAENFQRMGAFKFRGGFNAIASLAPEVRAKGVVAFSSGNHAQAVALAARLHGIAATIVMPHDSPPLKIEATKGYGADVVLYDRYKEDRAAIGARIADEKTCTLIPPFDYLPVMAGQGTCGLEIAEEVTDLDALIVCTGGGGFLAGCTVAMKTMQPHVACYGAEPEAGDDVRQSLREGEIVSIDVPKTICDGQQTQAVGKAPFEVIQKHVTDIFTAKDETVVEMMCWLFERMKIVVEPSGACALAALYENRERFAGRRVAVTLSGGNVDIARFSHLMSTRQRR